MLQLCVLDVGEHQKKCCLLFTLCSSGSHWSRQGEKDCGPFPRPQESHTERAGVSRSWRSETVKRQHRQPPASERGIWAVDGGEAVWAQTCSPLLGGGNSAALFFWSDIESPIVNTCYALDSPTANPQARWVQPWPPSTCQYPTSILCHPVTYTKV